MLKYFNRAFFSSIWSRCDPNDEDSSPLSCFNSFRRLIVIFILSISVPNCCSTSPIRSAREFFVSETRIRSWSMSEIVVWTDLKDFWISIMKVWPLRSKKRSNGARVTLVIPWKAFFSSIQFCWCARLVTAKREFISSLICLLDSSIVE